MAEVKVRRKFSFVYDRAPLFLYIDGVKADRLYTGFEKTFTVEEGKHEFTVRDLIGLSCKPLTVEVSEKSGVSLKAGVNGFTTIGLLMIVALAIILSKIQLEKIYYLAILIGALLFLLILTKNKFFRLEEE